MTATRRRIRSSSSAGESHIGPPGQQYLTVISAIDIAQSASPLRNGGNTITNELADLKRSPQRGGRHRCARQSGTARAAIAPANVMNWRRLMGLLAGRGSNLTTDRVPAQKAPMSENGQRRKAFFDGRYSITWFARNKIDCGNTMPSVFAVRCRWQVQTCWLLDCTPGAALRDFMGIDCGPAGKVLKVHTDEHNLYEDRVPIDRRLTQPSQRFR